MTPSPAILSGLLATLASEVRAESNFHWKFTSQEGVNVDAYLTKNWLILEAEPVGGGRWAVDGGQKTEDSGLRTVENGPDAQPSSTVHRLPSTAYRPLLDANASLPGLAKLVLDAQGRLRLRADLILDEELDLQTRIRAACAGFKSAWTPDGRSDREPTSTSPDSTASDLKRLCAEAGWPYVERASGKIAVELEVARDFYQGFVTPVGSGVHVSCDLAECRPDQAEDEQALAGLLLTAAGTLRLVRATVARADQGITPRLEVRFDGAPSAVELQRAFENLSAGCSLCGEEIKLLQDAGVAHCYREVRGWA